MSCQLPCRIVGKDVIIEVDVVNSTIPMLLSLKSLKKAKAKLNLEQDKAELLSTEVPLNFTSTSSGHYCFPVDSKNRCKYWRDLQYYLEWVAVFESGCLLKKILS